MSPVGIETKDHCAVESQQQFNSQPALHGIRTGRCFASRTKTNADRETETLNMSVAPRNRRGHLQLLRTYGRWQRITSYQGFPYENMERRVAKETQLKHLGHMRIWTNVGYISSY
jgi:hypothetical protein